MKTLIFGWFLLLFSAVATADTGWEDAARIERGSYIETRLVTISTYAATEFMPASKKRPDSLCKNFSSFTIYLGSAAAGITLAGDSMGLPIGTSEYFRIDGSMTGSISAIAEPSGTNVKIICLDGLVR